MSKSFGMDKSLPFELSARTNKLVWTETMLFEFNVAAFFGNLSVCYAVYRNQRLRTLAIMFVVALAVSDILMSTCCMPFSVATLYRGKWSFGDSFCRFHGFSVFTFGLASLHTMGIIAVSRYFRVVKPNKYIVIFKTRSTLLYIAAVWCVAFVGSVPPFFLRNGGFEFQAGKAMCLSSIGNGGIGTKCAENPTRKKCAKIPRSNISGMCGMSGMPRSNFPRSNISGMSGMPMSNSQGQMGKNRFEPEKTGKMGKCKKN